jgi:hypothetical protein
MNIEIWTAISEIVRNLGLLLAACAGLYLAWRRVTAADRQSDAALEQSEFSRRGHMMDLFNRAVGQLGHSNLEVRLGAVYTLEAIAKDFTELRVPVLNLLSAYMRVSSKQFDDDNIQDEWPVEFSEIFRILTSDIGEL